MGVIWRVLQILQRGPLRIIIIFLVVFEAHNARLAGDTAQMGIGLIGRNLCALGDLGKMAKI